MIVLSEAVTRTSSVKKVSLKISQNLQKNTCVRVAFFKTLQASGQQLLKKEVSDTVFSCEFCQIFKNTFFIEHHRCSSVFLSFFICLFVCFLLLLFFDEYGMLVCSWTNLINLEQFYLSRHYLLKVNEGNSRTRCEISSKLT